MSITKHQDHVHEYDKAEYIKLDRQQDVTNDNFAGMSKPILKLLVCKCGSKIGKDLLEKIPESDK